MRVHPCVCVQVTMRVNACVFVCVCVCPYAQVSEQGDVVYNFPRNFRSAIQSKSVWLSALPVLRGISNVGQYLVRVMFGTALVSSIAIVWLAIAVLLSSRGDRDDRRSQGSGGGYYNG